MEIVEEQVEAETQSESSELDKALKELEYYKAELELQSAQKEQVKQEQNEVEIPEIPNPQEEDFEEKLKLREEAIVKNAHLQREREIESRRSQEETKGIVESYFNKGAELGIERSQLEQAGQKVLSIGLDDSVAEMIMKDPEGALIIKALSEDPATLNAMRGLSPAEMSVKIYTEVKPRCSISSDKISKTPDPVDVGSGNEMYDTISPLIKNASFE